MEANLTCANEQVAQFRTDCGNEVISGCADGGSVSTACSLAIQQVQVNCGDAG